MTTTPVDLAAMAAAFEAYSRDFSAPEKNDDIAVESVTSYHNAMAAFARYILAHPFECVSLKRGPDYTDAAGDSDYDLLDCGACLACQVNATAKELA